MLTKQAQDNGSAVVRYDPQNPIVKAIVDGTIPEVVDSDAMGAAMALRILEAPEDQAFTLRQATPITELLTVVHSVNGDGSENLSTPVLRIRGVSWQKSDFDSNGGIYAVIDAVELETGEAKVLMAGGRFLMAGLYRLEMDQAFPADMVAVQVGKAKNGQARALRLTYPPAAA